MGDYFQTLVAPEITTAQAGAEGDRLLAWLVAEEIVLPNTTDCVLSADTGHPPGPQYTKATKTANPHFLTLKTNGLALTTERTVFHSGQGGFELICSTCNAKFPPPARWGEAVSEWYDQSGPADLPCPSCGTSRTVTNWQHDPPWGFANLGFKFWNWPPLNETFIKDFDKQLGSRIVHVYGKL